jgi:hypothetical protein
LVPAEPKGCHLGSKGCKDKLMIRKQYMRARRGEQFKIQAGLITRKHLTTFHIAG